MLVKTLVAHKVDGWLSQVEGADRLNKAQLQAIQQTAVKDKLSHEILVKVKPDDDLGYRYSLA